MMQALVLHEKHGSRVVGANDLNAAALKVVTERHRDGYWYDNWDDGDPNHQWEDRAEQIVLNQNGRAAYDLLLDREDHEYEGFEIQDVL